MRGISWDKWRRLRAEIELSGKVYDNESKGVDTVIDWSNGGIQIITVTAIINITFTGWDALPQGTSGSLLIIDGDAFEPTWSDRNRGSSVPTYTDGFVTWLEFASVEAGEIYNMWQVSNDQEAVLDSEGVDDPNFDDTADWTESANMSVTGSQLVLTAATAETTVEVAPLVAVATAVYLVKTVIEEVTTAGGGVKVNVGSADGATHTTIGTKYDIITAVDTDGLEITAAGAAMTAKIGSCSVKRLL